MHEILAPSLSPSCSTPIYLQQWQGARRASHEKKTAPKKSPTRPTESRKSASSPRDSSAVVGGGGGGSGGGGGDGGDGGDATADGDAAGLEDRVKENFVTFASSVAKVGMLHARFPPARERAIITGGHS